MKCIVLYHEKVADYLLKYDLAEIQKLGKKRMKSIRLDSGSYILF